jgi:hypothetical protein
MEEVKENLLKDIKRLLADYRGLGNWTAEEERTKAIENLCIAYKNLED